VPGGDELDDVGQECKHSSQLQQLSSIRQVSLVSSVLIRLLYFAREQINPQRQCTRLERYES